MTDSQNPNPEEIDLAAGEEVIVDALTGEVTTLSADEVAAEEAAEQAAAATAVAVADVPDGISPELIYDPFGEEPLSTSKAEFEALLQEFSSDFQEFREGVLAALLVYVLDAPAAAEQRGVTPPSAPAVLTLHEAARFLRIGSDELERLTRRKEVSAWRIGTHWRFEPVAR